MTEEGAGPIRWSDRVLIVGMNGSGKSELAVSIFNQVAVRRVLIDPKGDWVVDGAPRWRLNARTESHAEAEVEGIDWSAPIIHVQPQSGNRPQLEALYRRIDQLPPVEVLTDECYMTTTGSWAPVGLRSILTTGRSRGLGHLGCTQRPLDISVALRSEAQHIMVFRGIGAKDLADLETHVPYVQDFDLDVAEAVRGLPPFGFVWFDKGAQEVRICDPLPLDQLPAGPVRKAPGR